MNSENKELNDLLYPRRRPGLIIVIVCLLIVACVFGYRLVSARRRSAGPGELVPRRTQPTSPSKTAPESSSGSGAVRLKPAQKTPATAADKAQAKPERQVKSPPSERSVSPGSSAAPAVREETPAKASQSVGMGADEARQSLANGLQMENAGDLLDARRLYADVLKKCAHAQIRSDCEVRLGRVNMGLLLTPRTMPEMTTHKIQPGDRIEKIARTRGTTKELVMKSNGIADARRIQVGQSLKICTGKFSIAVSKRNYQLVLLMNGEFCKKYAVGLGALDKTPVGCFVVTARDDKPAWWPPEGGGPIPYGDQRNLLGSRWLAIKDRDKPAEDRRGLGIHGTKEEDSIGKSMSRGCIRMLNSDVEELYLIVPEGTPVVITD